MYLPSSCCQLAGVQKGEVINVAKRIFENPDPDPSSGSSPSVSAVTTYRQMPHTEFDPPPQKIIKK